MRYEVPALNLSVRWEKEYTREKENNHNLTVLVYDCLAQLRSGQPAYCFTDEHVTAIRTTALKSTHPFTVSADYQDGIIVLRRER